MTDDNIKIVLTVSEGKIGQRATLTSDLQTVRDPPPGMRKVSHVLDMNLPLMQQCKRVHVRLGSTARRPTCVYYC